MAVDIEQHDSVYLVTINRPCQRNAVDAATASELYEAFMAFDSREDACVAVLAGAGGNFCSGADLSEIADLETQEKRLADGPLGPMGPTRG